MQKFLFIVALLFSNSIHSQFVRFRMDLLNGKINGKEMNIQHKIIQTDIKDTNDVLLLGFNSDNERLGVKFYLLKISTKDSTYYLPSMKLYFVERYGFIKEVPFNTPDYSHPLTKTNNKYKILARHEKTAIGDHTFEMQYNYYIDGSSLDFIGVAQAKNIPTSVVLAIKIFKMHDSLLLHDKKLVLKASTGMQTKELAKYNKRPVELIYRLQNGTIGNLECVIVESYLKTKDATGKTDSSSFIQAMSLVKKNGVYERMRCDDSGKNCTSEIFCDYDLIFSKKE